MIEPLDDLKTLDARLSARLRSWIARAEKLVESRIADAAAHASKAVVDAARHERDGRKAAINARRSASLKAGLDRLDELTESAVALVRDAREAFYRDSLAHWREVVDPSAWRSPDPQPTREGIARVRDASIQGLGPRFEIETAIHAQKALLTTTAGNAAYRDAETRGDGRLDPIDAWARGATQLVARSLAALIGDSGWRAHALAGLDLLDPKLTREPE